MAFVSIKNVFARAALATPEQFDEWSKLWRVAVDGGSQESLIAFMARESGLSEEQFLEKLAVALEWPFLNLKLLDIPVEARAHWLAETVAFAEACGAGLGPGPAASAPSPMPARPASARTPITIVLRALNGNATTYPSSEPPVGCPLASTPAAG